MFRREKLRTILICASALAAPALAASPALAAGKKTPAAMSMSEFKSLVQQSLGKESGAFGAAGSVQPGSIAGKSGYFFVFANATVGMIGKSVPKIVVDKTDPNKGVTPAEFVAADSRDPKCRLGSSDDKSASTPEKVSLSATSAMCNQDGKEVYEGFVKFSDERASADYLFWVYGKNVPAASARAVRDRLMEQLKKDYTS